MSIPGAKTEAEALLVLAQQADEKIDEIRTLLSQIFEKEEDIRHELQETGDEFWTRGTGFVHAGRLRIANYAAARVRLPQSTPSPTLTGMTVLETASTAWAFLDPEQPSED